jgi:hypothetical protein
MPPHQRVHFFCNSLHTPVVVVDGWRVPQLHTMATNDHPSMSLRGMNVEMFNVMRKQFSKIHQPKPPPANVEFSSPPYCKVMDSSTNQPVTVTSEVTEIVGWPSDDGSQTRFEIQTPADNLNVFWEWMMKTFGPGGKIAESYEKNYTAMGKLACAHVGARAGVPILTPVAARVQSARTNPPGLSSSG